LRRFATALFLGSLTGCVLRAQSGGLLDRPQTQKYEAYVTAAQGQVSIESGSLPWAVSSGERVPAQRIITTGSDGFAHFDVKGGTSFEIYSNSRVIFRQNPSTAGDLLDVLAGRVRIHLNPGPGQIQRIFCPVATITAVDPATVALAIDEDDNLRIDVLEGEIRVQHALLPRNEPTLVKAIDSILVQKDEQISRRVDRGSLYRYAIKPLHDLFSAMTPSHGAENKFFAWALPMEMRR
jgi:hypothetical protein